MSEEKKAFDEWMQFYVCDDPYWEIPSRYMDTSRVGQYLKKLQKLEKSYSLYIDDLYTGLPTCYSVLCLPKNASFDAVEKAYERKKRHSVYPDDVLKRAYEILSSSEKRSDYEEIIYLFNKIMQNHTAKEKQELIKEHASWLEKEKDQATFNYIREKHGVWQQLFFHGAPTFYELLGVDRTKLKSGEEVKCENKDVDKRLVEEIYKIINNPQLRFEYDFMLDILDEMFGEEKSEMFKSEKTFWKGRDVVYLMILKYYEPIKKYEQLIDMHNDWEAYIEDRTFYDVLTIDMASISGDKQEVENTIRNAYKDKERTPEVNLAYSVLKNFRLRNDYDWLLKNKKWLDLLHEIDVEEVDDAEINKVMKMVDELATELKTGGKNVEPTG